ncbi:hypothetical protein JZ751_006568 [Albula glossodonta]|uniref:[histone H3]-lysine(4) N-trimethyltransferase n=1 Tax=Albula glossodonta TaxID=121402 RepID=A0A8T2MV32_9TELE|nr:hypothetical protein JZ751_004358 [Albula glossodonta]KAG9334731.1 hypothetical protein JZ751_006568 [Albula glossodonta]
MENVRVFDSPGKGRGLRAAKEIMVEHVCHSCFRRQQKLQRCGQCKFAQYCDRTCQRAGWSEHKQECAAIKAYGKVPNENVRLAAQILWRIDKEGEVVSDLQLTTLEDLEDHVSDMPEDDLKELKVDIHNFLDYWPRNSKQHRVDYISHIFGVAVGVGLFPNLCLVNHDCWPNCTVILNHGKIELRALGKIAEGEEVTVAYVDFLNLSTERQRLLKQQYFFDCTCHHCTNHIKDDIMMGGLETEGNKPSEELLKEVTDYSLQTLEKIEKARLDADYKEVVKLCRECLKRQEPVLAETHLYLLRVLSVLSELGMATMRAGVTHWHAGLIEVGHGMICKAYAILMITHGATHPITKDLEAMRMQTEMELRMFQQNEYVYYSMREAALKNQPMSMMAEPVAEGIKSLFRKK